MKKLIAGICMAVVMVGSVFAAGSTTAIEGTVKDAEGNALDVQIVEGTDAVDSDAAKTAVKADDYTVAFAKDVVLSGDYDAEAVFPIEITFSGLSVKAGDEVIVAHLVDGAWKNETVVTVADGSVTAKFDTLSPVVILVKEATSTEGGDSTPSAGGNTAPRTGEPAVMAVVGLVAMAALLGMAVTAKKEN